MIGERNVESYDGRIELSQLGSASPAALEI